jgi:hypothetical protein
VTEVERVQEENRQFRAELARAREDSAHASGSAVQEAAWVAVKKTPTA